MGQTESFEYDEETLRLIQHTDFEGNITESVYSDLGFLDELQYFAPGSDPATDPADEVVEYTYNSLDQREQITDTRGDTDYTYDEFDRLSQIDTPEGVLNYEYDNYGRQVRKSIGNPADPTHDWTYTYDARVAQKDSFWADEVGRRPQFGLPLNPEHPRALRKPKPAPHRFALSYGCAAPKESFGATRGRK